MHVQELHNGSKGYPTPPHQALLMASYFLDQALRTFVDSGRASWHVRWVLGREFLSGSLLSWCCDGEWCALAYEVSVADENPNAPCLYVVASVGSDSCDGAVYFPPFCVMVLDGYMASNGDVR